MVQIQALSTPECQEGVSSLSNSAQLCTKMLHKSDFGMISI